MNKFGPFRKFVKLTTSFCFAFCLGSSNLWGGVVTSSNPHLAELSKQKTMALRGDAREAMSLYTHYVNALNPKGAATYIVIAAENGNLDAQVELASILLNHKGDPFVESMFRCIYGGLGDAQLNEKGSKLDDEESLARLRAVYWLKIAGAKGSSEAKEKLVELGE